MPTRSSSLLGTEDASPESTAARRADAGLRPQLNPVEGDWSHLKGGVLANRGDDTVEELIELATGGVHEARSQQLLLFGFLGQTGLTL
jgi:hypothetical protein